MSTTSNDTPLTSSVSSLMPPPRIIVVAGEASSDLHAAALVRELRALVPAIEVFGMGGSALRAAGMETIIDSEHTASVMGFTEVFRSIRKLYRAFHALHQAAVDRSADIAVLVDFPDFNLRLAKRLHRAGIPVLYYISPQLWAWRSGRVKEMKRSVRKVAAIFPFEESFYHRHGVDAEYVGHPLVKRNEQLVTRAELARRLGVSEDRPIVALLPGSRKAEIEQLFPSMLEAAARIARFREEIVFVTPIAPGVTESWLRLVGGERASRVHFYQGQARDVLSYAVSTVVASGTATVETALAGSPMIVVYRLSPLTYRVARRLVRGVRYFAMPNLIAGEQIVTELLQDDVTGERIASELELLLGDPHKRALQRHRLDLVKERLQTPHDLSPPARTAEIALSMVLNRREGSTGGTVQDRARRGNDLFSGAR